MVLEFSGASTADAAQYSDGLCRAWALAIAEAVSADTTTAKVIRDSQLVASGRVKRHKTRGADDDNEREVREREDRESQAGMRNPARLEKTWPQLWITMDMVASILREARRKNESLQDLTKWCTADSPGPNVDEALLVELRRMFVRELGGKDDESDHTHEASPWRPAVVEAVQRDSDDPDHHLPGWLRSGVLVGVACEIPMGGLFPQEGSHGRALSRGLSVLREMDE